MALALAVWCNRTELPALSTRGSLSACLPPGQKRQSIQWIWIRTFKVYERVKNKIKKKITCSSLSFRRQCFTKQAKEIGAWKCFIFFWSATAYLPNVALQPWCSRDPAVFPGISSAAVMLTLQDKTLLGQREMMHDRTGEGGSKHNVPSSLGFLQRRKIPWMLFRL